MGVNDRGVAVLRRFLITVIVLISLASMVHAASTDWSVHIKVSVPDSRGADGTVWNHLIAGTHEGATDGFDSSRDTLSMVETDDPVQAMFTHGSVPEDKNNDGILDSWACNAPEEGYTDQQCSLWRDIRRFEAEKAWSFLALSTLNGGTVTLQWSFQDLPEAMDIVLVDLSNQSNVINMRNISLYSYTSNFEPGKRYGIRYFEIRMKSRGLFITLPALPDATIGALYSKRLSAAGGMPVWSLADGDLPPGMFIDPFTGEITGIPTEIGTYRFTVRGDDPVSGYSRLHEYTMNINSMPQIDASSLPDGIAGSAYNRQFSVTGGSAPITWSIRGNLPEGVTLDRKTGTISGTLIVPGIYDFTSIVKDANGATDSKTFRITVIEPDDQNPPEAIRDLRGMYINDTAVLLIWTAPSDDSMTRTPALYDLRYMQDCVRLDDSTWEAAVEVNGEPRPQQGVLHTYTLTGLRPDKTYCVAIRSMDASGHLSPLSNTVMVPLSSVSPGEEWGQISNLSPLTLRKGYNLISLPLIPLPNWRESLFGPILGNPVALYRWYSAYPDLTPPQYYLEDTLMPGLGYFLYSSADNVRIDIDGLRLTDPEYRVSLQHGWNMIGTPYDKAILLHDIEVRDNTTKEVKSYTDSVKAGWIGNTIYRLNSGNYDFASFNDDPPAALEPWVGYWIYVSSTDGVEIIFRRPG